MNRQRQGVVASLAAAVLLVVLMSGCPGLFDGLVPNPQSEAVQDITASAAHTLMQDHPGDPNFVFLDVRTTSEFASGHIEGAVNMPIMSSVSFRSDVSALDKTLTYLAYCSCSGGSQGGGRSASAARIMAEVGFTNLYVLVGGFTQWSAEGYPTVQSE